MLAKSEWRIRSTETLLLVSGALGALPAIVLILDLVLFVLLLADLVTYPLQIPALEDMRLLYNRLINRTEGTILLAGLLFGVISLVGGLIAGTLAREGRGRQIGAASILLGITGVLGYLFSAVRTTP